MKVLIVEDNDNDRKLLRYTFEHHGCSVVEGKNGREGLEQAAAQRPDIIVSDALMPIMDGFQLLRALKSDPDLAAIPFIFYSATYTGQREAELALSLGAEAFFLKPKAPEELWQETSDIYSAWQARAGAPLPARKDENEVQYLKEYSQIVATKLEAKVQELEATMERQQQAETEVRRLNAQLEERVQERTAQLEQRTRELEESRLALVNLVEDLNRTADELTRTNASLTDEINQRQLAEEEILCLNADLQRQKAALEAANREMETFSYSVSHDLKTPVRHISGFVDALKEEYGELLDAPARHYLQRIDHANRKMGDLIDALLRLARASRSEMSITTVNLSALAHEQIATLSQAEPQRRVTPVITDNIRVQGDQNLMQILMANLLGNAWKYTRNRDQSTIEFGSMEQQGRQVCFVRDNGVGFDMNYADKLFGAFQRLHTEEEFEGTGIGLATVQRIILRHGGQLWAEGKVGEGATFYFSI